VKGLTLQERLKGISPEELAALTRQLTENASKPPQG
jgi:hypothetical protein